MIVGEVTDVKWSFSEEGSTLVLLNWYWWEALTIRKGLDFP